MLSSRLYDISLQSLRNLEPQKEKIVRAETLLNQRYAECDSKGHFGPNENGVCQYCQRHYEYEPLPAEIPLQRKLDHADGLRMILGQL